MDSWIAVLYGEDVAGNMWRDIEEVDYPLRYASFSCRKEDMEAVPALGVGGVEVKLP
jgi:hypothetical protein